jgi:hypothetical protein
MCYTLDVKFFSSSPFAYIQYNSKSCDVKGKKISNIIVKTFQEIAFFDDHDNNVGALTTRLSTDASQVQGVSC